MESKLMPCKCGGESETFESVIGWNETRFGVKCKKCGRSMEDKIFSKNPPTKLDWERVKAAWNRRNADDHK